MQSWRLCGLRLHEFETWCWAVPMDLSSLAASMSTAVELLEGRIDIMAANGVRWGSCSTLVATMSHFLELKTKMEVLKSGRSVDLTEDEAHALWIGVRVASFLLVSHVPSSVARNPPDGMGE
jgi:hypothetical protein